MSEWISIKDKLPVKDCECLVITQYRRCYVSKFIKYRDDWDLNAFMHTVIELHIDNVTHWMDIPKLPEFKE